MNLKLNCSSTSSRTTIRRISALTFALAVFAGLTDSVTAQNGRRAARMAGANRLQSDFAECVSATGSLKLPADYKTGWVHLGSWGVAKKEGEPVTEMHVVYTQPKTVDYYNRHGDFPDGAVLVKEVRDAKTHTLTTGFAASESSIKVWFLMIRDRKGRFAGNPNWKEGWAWGLYTAKQPAKNVSESFDKSCKSCHLPQQSDHWVYTFGYPALKNRVR